MNYEAFFKGENSTCFCTVVHSFVVVFFCSLHVIKAGIGGAHTQYAFIISCASCWCISFIVALALTHETVLQAHAVVLNLGSTLLIILRLSHHPVLSASKNLVRESLGMSTTYNSFKLNSVSARHCSAVVGLIILGLSLRPGSDSGLDKS